MVIKRVRIENGLPSLAHQGDVTRILLRPLALIMPPKRRKFVMHEFCSRRPNNAPACGPQPKAKVDIVIGERHRFVEATNCSENIGADRHAGGGDARDVLFQTGASKVTLAPRGSR